VREVEAPIGRDPRNRLRMAVVDLERHAGKTAATRIECLESTGTACLVRCTLRTGRTHQIRVHMAHLGHALVGDVLYGGPPGGHLARQALHAWQLGLIHPVSGRCAFRARCPWTFLRKCAPWGFDTICRH
jgi:23S rRNA pseudouridine1911/1915/1917 synthase